MGDTTYASGDNCSGIDTSPKTELDLGMIGFLVRQGLCKLQH